MNVKTKTFRSVASLFRITDDRSWSRVSAADILAVPGVGKSWLNQLRLYLAHRGVNLRGDNPASYWLDNLGGPKRDDLGEVRGVCPFTVVIDTNETFPFSFDGITDREGNLISVPTTRRALYQIGLGDYTIHGMETAIQLERKGDDLPSSLAQRRDEFEGEISRLNDCCEYSAVIVEHPWRDILTDEHNHGASGKSISRTVLAWQIKYPGVHWWFCEGRFHAEQVAFRLLERFWWSKMRSETETVLTGLNDDLWRV